MGKEILIRRVHILRGGRLAPREVKRTDLAVWKVGVAGQKASS